MTQEISEKSKKNEILEAYHELLNKINEGKVISNQEVKKQKDNEEIVFKAATFDVEHIINDLAQVKLEIVQGIGELEKKLTGEYRRLAELQSAITIETDNLKEIHEIKKNADSLAALLLAQKEYRTRFEAQMEQRKNELEHAIQIKQIEWQHEQEQYEQDKKERDLRLKKERVREEEEYRYTLTLDRKKDQNAYEEKQNTLDRALQEKTTAFEKSCIEREAILADQEEELKTLRIRVTQFPHELETGIKNAEKTVKELLDREYRYKMELLAKETEGEKRLTQQMITSLQDKIKEQDGLIHQLSNKADTASNQVQSIALKALESASNRSMSDESRKTQAS